jgi:hypothetical protein
LFAFTALAFTFLQVTPTAGFFVAEIACGAIEIVKAETATNATENLIDFFTYSPIQA